MNDLNVSDEFRQVSDAVSRAIRLVDHGEDDPEAQLQFLTDCRGKFSGLDAVQTELVHCVNTLADRARKRMASRAKGGRIGARGKGFLQVKPYCSRKPSNTTWRNFSRPAALTPSSRFPRSPRRWFGFSSVFSRPLSPIHAGATDKRRRE